MPFLSKRPWAILCLIMTSHLCTTASAPPLRPHSVSDVSYLLERSKNLFASSGFTPLATNIPGQPGTTAYIDTDAANWTPLFYRMGVP